MRSSSNSTYVSWTRLRSHLDGPPREVDRQASAEITSPSSSGRLGAARTAQERPHPASELPDREGLRDVVVGAELEPEHLVELVVAGGEHDDRHFALGAQALADLEAVELRQHDVEHDQVDVLGGELRHAPPRRRVPGARGSPRVPVDRRAASELSPRRRRGGWSRGRACRLGGSVPAGQSLPGGSAPTIAPDGNRSAPDRAAPGASRLAPATGQRSSLPRNLAARRPASARGRVQRRAADAAAAGVPARLRRRSDQVSSRRISSRNNRAGRRGASGPVQWFRRPAPALRASDSNGDASAPSFPDGAKSKCRISSRR